MSHLAGGVNVPSSSLCDHAPKQSYISCFGATFELLLDRFDGTLLLVAGKLIPVVLDDLLHPGDLVLAQVHQYIGIVVFVYFRDHCADDGGCDFRGLLHRLPGFDQRTGKLFHQTLGPVTDSRPHRFPKHRMATYGALKTLAGYARTPITTEHTVLRRVGVITVEARWGKVLQHV